MLKNKVPSNIPEDISGKKLTFLNPYSYLYFRKSPDDFKEFDYILADGILFVLMLRILGVRTKRVSFDMSSLAPLVFSQAETSNSSIAIIGSAEGVVESAVASLRTDYPKLNVIELRNGYFKDKEETAHYIEKLSSLSPDIVIVGMGTPNQERFINALSRSGWEGTAFTCGGFLHQTSKKGNTYYPKIFDKLHLRWLYRIIDEPKLFYRYFALYPLSVILFIKDAISSGKTS